jgi:1-acyl-sn-glycerol-3-phosphate acyltransferase
MADQMSPDVERDEPTFDHEDEAFIVRWVDHQAERAQRIVRIVAHPIADYGFRLRSYGEEHIPESGAFLFCPNHSSYLDPFLQARGQDRIIRFMAKAQALDWPVAGSLLAANGSFPVRRGQGDARALEAARRMLLDGQPVGMYMEGTRFRKADELGPPRRGAARLVAELGVPVLPVATYGTKPRKARGARTRFGIPRVTTIYGPLISFTGALDADGSVDRIRDEIWTDVQRLYDIARDITLGGRRPAELPAHVLGAPRTVNL